MKLIKFDAQEVVAKTGKNVTELAREAGVDRITMASVLAKSGGVIRGGKSEKAAKFLGVAVPGQAPEGIGRGLTSEECEKIKGKMREVYGGRVGIRSFAKERGLNETVISQVLSGHRKGLSGVTGAIVREMAEFAGII